MPPRTTRQGRAYIDITYDDGDTGVDIYTESAVNPRTHTPYTVTTDVVTAVYHKPALPLPDDETYALDDASGSLYDKELLGNNWKNSDEQLAGKKRKRMRKERSRQSVSTSTRYRGYRS